MYVVQSEIKANLKKEEKKLEILTEKLIKINPNYDYLPYDIVVYLSEYEL